eukprot:CAMPEP_0182568220 /NCGR_PEP_ID=MMETSP1324-20130603/9228_1 /TAXON_ID=236786 /ORGANISM="Florenciella sp., Strain RCC1587" /LENGTH=90 /DNA_ID=CAMNT_0024782345 /DNA_START=37 /DNA_END=306 /DNA_ORIENTATION=+
MRRVGFAPAVSGCFVSFRTWPTGPSLELAKKQMNSGSLSSASFPFAAMSSATPSSSARTAAVSAMPSERTTIAAFSLMSKPLHSTPSEMS